MLAEAAHAAHEGGFVDQFWHLITNPAHWVFEYASAIPAILYTRFWVARHDRKHHKNKDT